MAYEGDRGPGPSGGGSPTDSRDVAPHRVVRCSFCFDCYTASFVINWSHCDLACA